MVAPTDPAPMMAILPLMPDRDSIAPAFPRTSGADNRVASSRVFRAERKAATPAQNPRSIRTGGAENGVMRAHDPPRQNCSGAREFMGERDSCRRARLLPSGRNFSTTQARREPRPPAGYLKLFRSQSLSR